MVHGQRSAAAAVAASLGALLLSAPPPQAAVRALVHAGSSTDPTGPLVAAIALAAWAVTGWLALTVTVVLLSRVPGLLGRTARAVAVRVAPATVRRAVEAVLGITVAVAVVTPTAALAAPTAVPSAAPTAVAGEAIWDLDWPSRTAQPPASPARPPAAVHTATPSAAVHPPTTSSPAVPPVTATPPPPSPRPPSATPARPTPAAVPPAARPASVAEVVVVQPGDTLWSLAEVSLRRSGTASPPDRQVAQAWPRWWAANREAIGDDPDLLLPGTVLCPPPGTH
jgi:hypothetical protein